MTGLASVLRYRNIMVAVLLVISVAMHLLPPAYLMVQHDTTGAPIKNLLSKTARDVMPMYYWASIAAGTAITAFLLFRARTIGIHIVFSLIAAYAWATFAMIFILYAAIVFLGWLPFIALVVLLGYPPYFALKRLTKRECVFSNSILEHLAAFAAFALPLLMVGFESMFDPKFSGFYF